MSAIVGKANIANYVLGAINDTAAQPTISFGGDISNTSSGTGVHGDASQVMLCVAGVDIATAKSFGLSLSALAVANSATATTPGNVVKKMEVFNASGVSLGFIAIYDAIV